MISQTRSLQRKQEHAHEYDALDAAFRGRGWGLTVGFEVVCLNVPRFSMRISVISAAYIRLPGMGFNFFFATCELQIGAPQYLIPRALNTCGDVYDTPLHCRGRGRGAAATSRHRCLPPGASGRTYEFTANREWAGQTHLWRDYVSTRFTSLDSIWFLYHLPMAHASKVFSTHWHRYTDTMSEAAPHTYDYCT